MSNETKWCRNCEQNVVPQDDNWSAGAVILRGVFVLIIWAYFHAAGPTLSEAMTQHPGENALLLLFGFILPPSVVFIISWWLDTKFSVKRCPICKGTDFLPPKRRLRSSVHPGFTEADGDSNPDADAHGSGGSVTAGNASARDESGHSDMPTTICRGGQKFRRLTASWEHQKVHCYQCHKEFSKEGCWMSEGSGQYYCPGCLPPESRAPGDMGQLDVGRHGVSAKVNP
ncbi:MAG TPA: hypothetical protein PLZ31_11760 [Myxococcota bacterium]|nr:hypothetical protein [Myxococcota bacterium]